MRYVAVEGPTGVGKTTFAVCLQERLGWPLLVDPYEANPFLAQYYRPPSSGEWSPLLVESAFVFLRLAQLRTARITEHSKLITDYTFIRTKIYADLLPHPPDRSRLKELVSLWIPDVPEPDTIVLLSASFETLQTRIRRRGRPIERSLADQHIRDLMRAYADYASLTERSRIVDVPTDGWDPRVKTDLDFVIDQLDI
jgi:deoxyadenosine/deoxycytidine kinase